MELRTLFRDIAGALREKDGSEEPIAAGDFPARIRAIPGAAGAPLEPFRVYQAARPAEWLEVPEPEEDELYLLVHIPDGRESMLAFTVTCAGSYTVELGALSGGSFVTSVRASAASGAKYETVLRAEDWGNLAGGVRQVLVRIRGRDILTWEPSVHSKRTSPSNFSGWNIVEIKCRLPCGTAVRCGSGTGNRALKGLKFFTWRGENSLTSLDSMFYSCVSLITVLELNTSKAVSAAAMFYNCAALTALPGLDTSGVSTLSRAFYGCGSLVRLPELDTARAVALDSVFRGCASLSCVPPLNTAQAARMDYIFYGCASLTAIPRLSTGQASNLASAFGGCYAVSRILLDPAVTGWTGAAMDLRDCSLSLEALTDLFYSLPAISAAKTLTLTGNPGASELTDEVRAIAENKNWTLRI